MKLRFIGKDAKFTFAGLTWTSGEVKDVAFGERDCLWLLRHGFEVCETAKLQMIDERPRPEIGRPLPEPVFSDTLQVAETTPPMFPRRGRR